MKENSWEADTNYIMNILYADYLSSLEIWN